jgi:hypothetical protein
MRHESSTGCPAGCTAGPRFTYGCRSRHQLDYSAQANPNGSADHPPFVERLQDNASGRPPLAPGWLRAAPRVVGHQKRRRPATPRRRHVADRGQGLGADLERPGAQGLPPQAWSVRLACSIYLPEATRGTITNGSAAQGQKSGGSGELPRTWPDTCGPSGLVVSCPRSVLGHWERADVRCGDALGVEGGLDPGVERAAPPIAAPASSSRSRAASLHTASPISRRACPVAPSRRRRSPGRPPARPLGDPARECRVGVPRHRDVDHGHREALAVVAHPQDLAVADIPDRFGRSSARSTTVTSAHP